MTLVIAWNQVCRRPAADLAVGDTWIVPEPFTVYWAAPDGRVCGHSWHPLTGTAWTVLARDGDVLTSRSGDGLDATARVPARAQVLRVEPT